MDASTAVSLSVPADPESISIVRSVVASVASKLEVTYDAVDDLRIAAAEAATLVLATGSGGRLRVDLSPGGSELTMRVWRDGAAEPATDIDRGGLAWRVIEGLTDGAEVGEVDGSVSVELTVRTVPR